MKINDSIKTVDSFLLFLETVKLFFMKYMYERVFFSKIETYAEVRVTCVYSTSYVKIGSNDVKYHRDVYCFMNYSKFAEKSTISLHQVVDPAMLISDIRHVSSVLISEYVDLVMDDNYHFRIEEIVGGYNFKVTKYLYSGSISYEDNRVFSSKTKFRKHGSFDILKHLHSETLDENELHAITSYITKYLFANPGRDFSFVTLRNTFINYAIERITCFAVAFSEKPKVPLEIIMQIFEMSYKGKASLYKDFNGDHCCEGKTLREFETIY